MAGKRKSLASPNSPGKPQKKVKTEPVTPNKAKEQKNTPKKNTPKVKDNKQQAKKKNVNSSSVSPNANKNSEKKAVPVKKTFSKRKFRDFVKDAATGEVQPEEALTKIQEQINKIQTADDLSNTAKRKLSKLYSIADKIQKQSGINKIDISKQKALKPVGKIIPKAKNEKPKQLKTKPTKKDDADNKNKDSGVDQSEEEWEENSVEGGDNSEDGEEEDEDSHEGEEDSEMDEEDSVEGEVDSAEESGEDEEEEDDDDDDEEDEDEDDDGADDNKQEEKKEQTINIKTNEKKEAEVQTDKKEEILNDFTIFVGNIPFETTDDEVKEYFSKAGGIVSVVIPRQRKENKSRGFAIITLKDKESYDKALSFHYTHLNGRQIYVRHYHQKPKSSLKGGPNRNFKQFGNQGNQKFNPNNRAPKQGGGFNPRNKRPMQGGGFKPKNKFQNKKDN
ncbi:nuclear localization sequence-binding protein-like isoform X2 [Agrilus planipennis]|nr:nuclear localization sequence-binding protein-like isoform X2 [Agrilus planipennis]